MAHTIHDIGVASQIGAYSDSIEAAPNLRWLVSSGTPGLSTKGELPSDIAGQAELAWEHTVHMLDRARMTVSDLVKVTQYLTRAEDIQAYAKVRNRFLGDARPASMLLVIPELVRPEFLVEVEVMAAARA
ncbi:MAG TPA: Rid family hydrolase [Roseiarcus sp.]|jgi:enamine deaminase RidA (YjgF/YER057c/UK114 family)